MRLADAGDVGHVGQEPADDGQLLVRVVRHRGRPGRAAARRRTRRRRPCAESDISSDHPPAVLGVPHPPHVAGPLQPVDQRRHRRRAQLDRRAERRRRSARRPRRAASMIATSARTSVRFEPVQLGEPLPDCIQLDGQPAKEESELLARIDAPPPTASPSAGHLANISTIEIIDHQGKSCLAARSAGSCPPLVLLVWLGSAAPLSALGAKLTGLQENDIAAFLPDSAESTRVQELQAGLPAHRVDPRRPAVGERRRHRRGRPSPTIGERIAGGHRRSPRTPTRWPATPRRPSPPRTARRSRRSCRWRPTSATTCSRWSRTSAPRSRSTAPTRSSPARPASSPTSPAPSRASTACCCWPRSASSW